MELLNNLYPKDILMSLISRCFLICPKGTAIGKTKTADSQKLSFPSLKHRPLYAEVLNDTKLEN